MIEISSLIDKVPVYTRTGSHVGHVKNAILDLEGQEVEAILVTRTNPDLVEDGKDVAVPYRWVADFEDVMVLRYFPDHVTADADAPPGSTEEEEFIEVTA